MSRPTLEVLFRGRSFLMLVTVAICTWNRAALLARTLEKLRGLHVPCGTQWELLVVNNNCSDHTDETLRRFSGFLPLRRIFEPNQGLSHARNTAVRNTRGELLLWTDDDVLVEPDWLAAYLNAAEAYPAASFFMGTVAPWFEAEPPAWIRRHLAGMAGVYMITAQESAVRPHIVGDPIAGANMAFRTACLRRFEFNTVLGRQGNRLVGAEDTEMLLHMREAGLTGVLVGTAKVRHFIPQSRLNKHFVWRWFEGAGRTVVRQQSPIDCARIGGVPRWALARFCRVRMRAWALSPFKGSEAWFAAFREAATLSGYMREAYSLTQPRCPAPS